MRKYYFVAVFVLKGMNLVLSITPFLHDLQIFGYAFHRRFPLVRFLLNNKMFGPGFSAQVNYLFYRDNTFAQDRTFVRIVSPC